MRKLVAAILVLVSGSTWARAEEESLEDLARRFVDIHALVSSVYLYSFNKPASGELPFRVIDKVNDSITLHQASLFFRRLRDNEDFGFAFTLDFGHIAEFASADWDGSGTIGDNSEESNSFELREAYLRYRLPVELAAGRPQVKAGKFVTLLGYEVLKTYENFNQNISHSIAFGFGIPFTHTGLLLNVPLTEQVTFDVGVVNGWDNVRDNNSSKTLLAGLGVAPIEKVSLYVAGTYGAERNGIGRGGPGSGVKRGVLTANVSVAAAEGLTFVLDGVYGSESDLVPAAAGFAEANWYGLVGYAIGQVTKRVSLILRAEVFDDPDGTRNFSGQRATLWEVTPTVAVRLTDFVLARVEYRHDEANKQIFEKESRLQRGSDTLAAEVLLGF